MLVLSRKKNETINIGDDITIVVVEIRGDKVRLGIEAPKEVPVHRKEVYDAINRGETREASVGEALPVEEARTTLPSVGVSPAPLAHRVSAKSEVA